MYASRFEQGGSLLNDLLLTEHSTLLRGKAGNMHQFKTDFLLSNIRFLYTISYKLKTTMCSLPEIDDLELLASASPVSFCVAVNLLTRNQTCDPHMRSMTVFIAVRYSKQMRMQRITSCCELATTSLVESLAPDSPCCIMSLNK